jgi:hypothetical protein
MINEYSASEGCLQGNSFDDHSVAGVESSDQGTEDVGANHASRCPDTLEFDLRHGGICVEVLSGD